VNPLSLDFMQNAYLVASVVAVTGGAVGFFVVLRQLSFASHALAHVGFAGATGAVLLGVPPLYGLLLFTITGGALMGYLGERVRGRDVAIGMVLSAALGLGALFLTLYTRYANETFSILFGTVLGVSREDVARTASLGALTLLALGALYRPLLFSSLDPDVAAAKGVPVRGVSVAFFLLLAVAVSVAVQVVGVLLVFTLVLAPAATAQLLTVRPGAAIAVAVLLGLVEVWAGITLAYYIPWPVSFFIA
jgi:zinc/manganese transport system permease protein